MKIGHPHSSCSTLCQRLAELRGFGLDGVSVQVQAREPNDAPDTQNHLELPLGWRKCLAHSDGRNEPTALFEGLEEIEIRLLVYAQRAGYVFAPATLHSPASVRQDPSNNQDDEKDEQEDDAIALNVQGTNEDSGSTRAEFLAWLHTGHTDGLHNPLPTQDHATLLRARATDAALDRGAWSKCFSELMHSGFLSMNTAQAPPLAALQQQYWYLTATLVQMNVRLALHYAFRDRNRIGLDEALGVGIVGLVTAVSKYEVSRGFKFSTYATHWVRQNIRRCYQDHGSALRMPVHVLDKVWRAMRDLGCTEYQYRHELTTAKIADITGLTEIEAARVQTNARRVRVAGESRADHHSPMDLVFDGARLMPSEASLGLGDRGKWPELEARLYAAVEHAEAKRTKLKQRVKDPALGILVHRLPLGRAKNKTLEELGQQRSISRERVRQLQDKLSVVAAAHFLESIRTTP